jgi:hypothetical protein
MRLEELLSRVNLAVGASDWADVRRACEELRQHFPSAQEGYRFGIIGCSGLSDFDAMDSLLLSAMQLFQAEPIYAYNYALSVEQRGDLAEARFRWEFVSKTYDGLPFAESWLRDFAARHASQFPDLQPSPSEAYLPVAFSTQALYESLKRIAGGSYSELPSLWWRLDRSNANPSLIKVGSSILRHCDTGDTALIRDVVSVLLMQAVRPDIDELPKLVEVILDSKLRDTERAGILIDILHDVIDGNAVSDTAGICALAFEIPLAPHNVLGLVTHWLLAPGYWRFSLMFGNNDHLDVKPRKATCFVAPLVELLITSRAINSLSHDQLYRIACVLYCTDRKTFIRLVNHCSALFDLCAYNRNSVFGGRLFSAVAGLGESRVQTGPAFLTDRSRRLKVAVCVSGQLRGFREAVRSWDLLGTQDHDVDTYVHTWKVIGRRFPDGAQAHRVFAGNFLSVYKKVYFQLSRSGIETLYPHFSRLFAGHEEVTLDNLRDTYKTENIVIEDDRAPEFQFLDTVMKMHYKIERCFSLVAESHKKYDLILRIRPDLLVEGQEPLDLQSLHLRSEENRIIFANFPPMISAGIVSWRIGACLPMMIGDLFALGAPASMNSYGSAYSDNIRSIQSGTFGIPKGFLAHTSLALLLMREGIFVDDVPGLRMVDFCEPSPIPPSVLRQALQDDISLREQNQFDTELLDALEP